jgi:hypothetical protein
MTHAILFVMFVNIVQYKVVQKTNPECTCSVNWPYTSKGIFLFVLISR